MGQSQRSRIGVPSRAMRCARQRTRHHHTAHASRQQRAVPQRNTEHAHNTTTFHATARRITPASAARGAKRSVSGGSSVDPLVVLCDTVLDVVRIIGPRFCCRCIFVNHCCPKRKPSRPNTNSCSNVESTRQAPRVTLSVAWGQPRRPIRSLPATCHT